MLEKVFRTHLARALARWRKKYKEILGRVPGGPMALHLAKLPEGLRLGKDGTFQFWGPLVNGVKTRRAPIVVLSPTSVALGPVSGTADVLRRALNERGRRKWTIEEAPRQVLTVAREAEAALEAWLERTYTELEDRVARLEADPARPEGGLPVGEWVRREVEAFLAPTLEPLAKAFARAEEKKLDPFRRARKVGLDRANELWKGWEEKRWVAANPLGWRLSTDNKRSYYPVYVHPGGIGKANPVEVQIGEDGHVELVATPRLLLTGWDQALEAPPEEPFGRFKTALEQASGELERFVRLALQKFEEILQEENPFRKELL